MQIMNTQNFTVIGVSEAYARHTDKQPLSRTTSNYQAFYETYGTTTKCGCSFYIKKRVKLIFRKNLNITLYDDDNEFQKTRIETINKNKTNIVVGILKDIHEKIQIIYLMIKLGNTLKRLR